MTLTKAIQLEFGRGLLSAFQKASRIISTRARSTRAKRVTIEQEAKAIAKAMKVKAPTKPTTKRTISKRKAVEIKAAGKESNKIEKSETIHIREADIAPKVKRNTRLAKKV
jgi:uncharacterized protein (UPF0333 family)